MDKLQPLLQVLADGEFHSGEALGAILGVSRTAVWKQLKKLQQFGLSAESVKGKGYRLPGGLNLLDERLIKEQLDPVVVRQLSSLIISQVIDSTNTQSMARIRQGLARCGDVLVSEQQTAGRGRRGRQWQSPYAANLYFSLVWEFAGGVAALEGLSLTVGVAVAEALASLGAQEIQLKWPNDVLCNGRKLAGVLLEMSGEADGPCSVVIGIGLNVKMRAEMAAAIDQPWTDLATIMTGAPERNRVLAALLNALIPHLQQFQEKGFAATRQRWQALDAFYQREVTVSQGDKLVLGKAAGVDESGAILIETGLGLQAFNGGEISLRLANVTGS